MNVPTHLDQTWIGRTSLGTGRLYGALGRLLDRGWIEHASATVHVECDPAPGSGVEDMSDYDISAPRITRFLQVFISILAVSFLGACGVSRTPPVSSPPVETPTPTPAAPVAAPTPLPLSTAPTNEYGGQWRHYPLSTEVYQLAVSNGNYSIWVLTEDGFSQLDFSIAQVTHFAAQNWHDESLSFATNASGQLWVGYVYGTPFAPGDYVWLGVSRFDAAPWNGEASSSYTFTYTFEYPSNPPYITLDSKDNLWAVAPNGDVVKFDGQEWTEWKWLGVTGRVNVAMSDRAGRLWLGATEGAYVFDEDGLSQILTADIKAMAEDSAGGIWFGTQDSGVVHLDGNTSTTHDYEIVDGLVSNKIQDIAVDHSGHVWLAYQDRRAVSQFDGRAWKTHPAPDGPIFNQVYDITLDGRGHVWFGTDVGISEFVPPESPTLAEATPSLAPTYRVAFVDASDFKVMQVHQVELPDVYGKKCCPAFSPDGQKTAFGTAQSMTQDIYVMNLDGSVLIRLASLRTSDGDGPDPDPAWSPDGRQIVFVNYDGGIYIVNATDGSDLTKLYDQSLGRHPVWSPDGQRIAFTSYTYDEGMEIYVMNSDGGHPRRLTYHEARDQQPAWSPDGRHIAFVSDRDGNDEIYIMNSDGGDLSRLTNNRARDWGPVWSPDGRHIVFTSDRDGQNGIFVMNSDGANQRWLMDDAIGLRFIESAR